MNLWRIIFANLKYSRRQHFGTCLGLSICSMMLVGALTIGDSIRNTLKQKGSERIGLVTHLLINEDGYFHSDLSERILESKDLQGRTKIAPLVMTMGTIASPDGNTRASGITVLGINDRFFQFVEKPALAPDLKKAGFWASPDLANELGVEVGRRLVLRIEEPGLFSRDAPLSGERDAQFLSWNHPYLGEMSTALLGNFSLRASMEPSRTIFVPLSTLQDAMFASFDPDHGNTGFANLLLVACSDHSMIKLEEIMAECWTLADVGLNFKEMRSSHQLNLRSRSVFLPDWIVEKAKEIKPASEGELTYLVNAIRKSNEGDEQNSGIIPYSMVTGIEPGKNSWLGDDWKEDQIAINEWAFKDLNLSLGDRVTLEYFVVGERRDLIEKKRDFVVERILPMPEKLPSGGESDWTPRFPGLSDAENCGEWDTGIPIKHKIRPKDELYWDNYRGTPKAFISLSSAQAMWENRWGRHTGLRFAADEDTKILGDRLIAELSPAKAGMRLVDFRKDAESAAVTPVNFSQLFLAFGFFVVVAGLSLSVLLFRFSIEQRNRQVGTLLSLGFTLSRIKIIIWVEAGIVCLIGTVLGLGWACFFGKGVLWMLGGSWGGAVAKLNIAYLPDLESIVFGFAVSLLSGLLILCWANYQQSKAQLVELLQPDYGPKARVKPQRSPFSVTHFIEGGLWAGVIILALYAWCHDLPAGPMFFGIGALVLSVGLFSFYKSTKWSFASIAPEKKNPLLNIDTSRGRKVVVVGILAMGSFLVIGAGAFRQPPMIASQNLKSGTGGFSHIVETSLPLYDDLMGAKVVELFDLNPERLKGLSIVSIRSGSGDDAHCLNLHNSPIPPLHGLPVEKIRGRFEFAEGNWSTLEERYPPNVIPAAVDQNTMMWSLKKRRGDRLQYIDSKGDPFEVEIAAVIKGSFLQGGLFISEKNWVNQFPDRGGYQQFWLGSNDGKANDAVNHLSDRLFNYGVRIESTINRLNQFKQVENTYLSIFQSLGGMGVLLGTIGLFVVVVRNLWERRKEQAILGALGFSLEELQKMSIYENMPIVIKGLCLGIGAGLLGVLPVYKSNLLNLSFLSITLFCLCLLVFSFLCLFYAVRIGLRQIPFDELRNE
jgi:putative ABC transport system permease protein